MIHEDLTLKIIGTQAADEVVANMPAEGTPMSGLRRRHLLESALSDYIIASDVPSLHVLSMSGKDHVHGLVWIEQAFCFKNPKRGPDANKTLFKSNINVGTNPSVEGQFRRRRIPHETGRERLSGQSQVYMVGYVEHSDATRVVLRPALIGARFVAADSMTQRAHLREVSRASPSAVDEFDGIEFDSIRNPIRAKDLRLLQTVPPRQASQMIATAATGKSRRPSTAGCCGT